MQWIIYKMEQKSPYSYARYIISDFSFNYIFKDYVSFNDVTACVGQGHKSTDLTAAYNVR